MQGNSNISLYDLRKVVNGLIADYELDGISDGYHTHEELYQFRKMYNACLFNEWARQEKYHVHKSKRHFDGEPCFDGNWFIVVAVLPDGQISNHYPMEDWKLFDIPATEKALFEFDGHDAIDVLERLQKLALQG